MNAADARTGHSGSALKDRAAALMPRLKAELKEFVAIPSVSEARFRDAFRPALLAAHDFARDLFAHAGCEQLDTLELPNTAPIVVGEILAPRGAATVLLYSHYDVAPPGDAIEWNSPPFEATERDGAIFGRGAADAKSNILVHVGALRAWDGRPPVGVKIVIEGQEEVGGGGLTTYPLQHPGLFASNVVIIGDMGSVRPGVPTLTAALRGTASVTVEVRTLAASKHSGRFGGAAPDALLTLVHVLASLHDVDGNVAVEGLRREDGVGGSGSEDEFRSLAEVQGDQPLIGTGTLGSRVSWGPAITVIGIDAPSADGTLNAVSPYARALLNLRVHHEQDVADAQAALMRHLHLATPFRVKLEVHRGVAGNGAAFRTSSVAYQAAKEAWSAAWGAETVIAGSGCSIPLASSLNRALPDADILVVGTIDGYANIHGPNERVLIDEFEKATLAEADFFGRLASTFAEAPC